MLSQRKLEERNDELALRLSEEMPICITSERLAQLINITLDMTINCNYVVAELERLLKEPQPNFECINCTIDSSIAAINALTDMHFINVSPIREINKAILCFLKLRNEILYKAYSSLRTLKNEIPMSGKKDKIIIKYQLEKKYTIDERSDICFILDRNIPNAKRAVDNVISDSDLSFFVKNVMAEPFCCPNNNWDDTVDNYMYDIYTIVIISFWNPVKQEEVSSLFPDAFFPDKRLIYEYYNRYFLYESHFRELPSYDDIKSPS